MTELLALYEKFFKKINRDKFKTPFPFNLTDKPSKYKKPAKTEMDNFAAKFNVSIPPDIIILWKSLKNVYEVYFYSDAEGTWTIGWGSVPLDSIKSPVEYNAENKESQSEMKKKYYEMGMQLAFSKLKLLFDAEKGSIHGLIPYEPLPPEATPRQIRIREQDILTGRLFKPIPDEIAPDFRTFFEHWLASGCYASGDYKTFHHHWNMVKDIVPVKIPPHENVWLKYYCKLYNDNIFEDRADI